MKARTAIGLAAIIAAGLLVGMCDKQALDEQQREYCNNVRDGVWPDYHKSFKQECGGEDPPKFYPDLTK